MSREHCADCGGPREPGSSYSSYCMACGRKRQRERYKAMREGAGLRVNSRIDVAESEVERRNYLGKQMHKPGACELCGEFSERLLLVSLARDARFRAVGYGDPLLLACDTCHEAANLTYQVAKSVMLVMNYVAKSRIPWEMLVTELTPRRHISEVEGRY